MCVCVDCRTLNDTVRIKTHLVRACVEWMSDELMSRGTDPALHCFGTERHRDANTTPEMPENAYTGPIDNWTFTCPLPSKDRPSNLQSGRPFHITLDVRDENGNTASDSDVATRIGKASNYDPLSRRTVFCADRIKETDLGFEEPDGETLELVDETLWFSVEPCFVKKRWPPAFFRQSISKEKLRFPLKNGRVKLKFCLDAWVETLDDCYEHLIGEYDIKLAVHLEFGRLFRGQSAVFDFDGATFKLKTRGIRTNMGVNEYHKISRLTPRTAAKFADIQGLQAAAPVKLQPHKRGTNLIPINALEHTYGRLEVLSQVCECGPSGPAKATNTGLAFPHVLATAANGSIKRFVFTQRDVLIQARICIDEVAGEAASCTVCEQSVLSLLEAETPGQQNGGLVFKLDLVGCEDGKNQTRRVKPEEARCVAMNGGHATFCVRFKKGASLHESVFEVTAEHPLLSEHLRARSEPFSVVDGPPFVYNGVELAACEGYTKRGTLIAVPQVKLMDETCHRRTPASAFHSDEDDAEEAQSIRGMKRELISLRQAMHQVAQIASSPPVEEEDSDCDARSKIRRIESIASSSAVRPQLVVSNDIVTEFKLTLKDLCDGGHYVLGNYKLWAEVSTGDGDVFRKLKEAGYPYERIAYDVSVEPSGDGEGEVLPTPANGKGFLLYKEEHVHRVVNATPEDIRKYLKVAKDASTAPCHIRLRSSLYDGSADADDTSRQGLAKQAIESLRIKHGFTQPFQIRSKAPKRA